jgi:hypothetical protein
MIDRKTNKNDNENECLNENHCDHRGGSRGGVRGVWTPPMMTDPLLLVIIANKAPNSKGC